MPNTEATPVHDDAPPFTDIERRTYVIDPDKVFSIVRPAVLERDDAGDEAADNAFVQSLIGKLHDNMAFIKLNPTLYRNKYHNVVGDIYVLFATPWEYIIAFKQREVGPQKNRVSPEAWATVLKDGMGYSGRYTNTVFRTIPVVKDQLTVTSDGEYHVHSPGSRAFLPAGTFKYYKSGWIIECAHGQLWKAMPRFFWENRWLDVKGQTGVVLRGLKYKMTHRAPNAAAF